MIIYNNINVSLYCFIFSPCTYNMQILHSIFVATPISYNRLEALTRSRTPGIFFGGTRTSIVTAVSIILMIYSTLH